MRTFQFISTLLLGLLPGSTLTFAAAPPPSELKDASGKTIIQYVIETPDSVAPANTADPAQQLGLILVFPEHDRPVGDEIYPVREALKRLGIRDQYIILAGGPQGHKFGAVDHEPIAKLIEWAKKTYPVNPRRVYMYGKGEGGKISGELAMLNPNVIAGSISYSWSWWTMPNELTPGFDPVKSGAEIYMVLGMRDLSYHLTNVRDGFSRVHAKGYHVIFREFDELAPRTYHPPSNDDAIAWASRLRNKNLPLSSGEKKILAAKPVISSRGYYESLAIVGGVPAGEVLQKLLASSDAKVRTAAAETFSYGIFGEEANAALGTKLTDPVPAVRRSAVKALALQANWRSQSAQDALTSFVADPSKAVSSADRVAAADAIVYAVRLQINGVRQDPGLFKALIQMLKDEDEELRTIANSTLAPIRDRSFRGDLGRKELTEPKGGWEAWLAETTETAAGYRKYYSTCASADSPAAKTFCEGGAYLTGKNFSTGKSVDINAVKAFQLTLESAKQGYHPAEAVVGIMYVIGKGTEQNNPEGAVWLAKAADSGDKLAATNANMLYNGSPGIRKNKDLAEKYLKISSILE